MAVQGNPTFDIAPLNTKQFAQGISTPLGGNELWFYLQRGFDASVILPLLIAEIRILVPSPAKGNNPAESFSEESTKTAAVLDAWISQANRSTLSPKIVSYTKTKQTGPDLPLTVLKSSDIIDQFTRATAAKLEVKALKDKIRLFSTSKHFALCIPNPYMSSGYEAVALATGSFTSGPAETDIPPNDGLCSGTGSIGTNQKPTRPRKVVYLRSVEGMFYYLGNVGHSVQNRIGFYLHEESIPHEAFSVAYRKKTYHVAIPEKGDNTLTILAILNDMLNLHRDAGEIPTTKAVQTVP